jgi:hypothetical protein
MLELEYQQSGDLKNLIAVRNERKRFIIDPSPDAVELVTSPDELRSLQESYIANYSSIYATNQKNIDDLKDKYKVLLKKLQITLTKQGKIDEALVVMNEIESPESGDTHSSGRLTPYAGSTNSEETSKTLNTDTLGTLIHGKVTRWSSYNNEITIYYDFSDSNQMLDWKGGKMDVVNNMLICDATVAWFKLQMKDLNKIECDMSLTLSSSKAGLVIGNSLTAVIEAGRKTTAKVYQSSPLNPLLEVSGIDNRSSRKYNSLLKLKSKEITWSINGELPRRGVASPPITYPAFVGLGNMTSSSSYDNITITGILSDKQVEYLKKQL